ncbi:MAG: PIN domain-containing protein [Bacteroidales bacterium]|nr:PIN domain-containing protein [Bacteroidales bacterium]
MLDTCAIIDLLIDMDNLSKVAQNFIEDYNNTFYASSESMRELIVLFNNKKLLNKHFKTAEQVLAAVENDLRIDFLPIRPDVCYTYSRLRLNEAMNHYDPSDHIIISHAITERMALMSSDRKFEFYQKQGLELILY